MNSAVLSMLKADRLRAPAPALAATLALLAGMLPGSTALAQTPPDPAADTAGWTSQEGAAATADSLPAFRPDSLKDQVIRSAESAPSPFAGKATPRDSADSVAALLRGRRPAVSVHLGFNFTDLDAKKAFSGALGERQRRDSLDVLQPYESVHIAIPAGIQAVIPAGPWFDLVAKTHSYWYKQTAVLGKAGASRGEESYALQAHLGGVGLRYYVPPDLLSVTGKLGIYVQGVYYWLLGGGEIYTHLGSARAEFDPAGSAWEIQLGFNRALRKSFGITGGLGFIQQEYASDTPWTDLLAANIPAGKVAWSAGALQATFNFAYHFGVKTPPPTPSPSPSPAGTGTRPQASDSTSAAPPEPVSPSLPANPPIPSPPP